MPGRFLNRGNFGSDKEYIGYMRLTLTQPGMRVMLREPIGRLERGTVATFNRGFDVDGDAKAELEPDGSTLPITVSMAKLEIIETTFAEDAYE